MITFEIKLSVNQIACLRAIREFNDRKADELFRGLPNWISGSRLLIAENLITYRQLSESEEKKIHKPRMTDATVHEEVRQIWQITRKGRLVLELFELDVLDASAAINDKVKDLCNPPTESSAPSLTQSSKLPIKLSRKPIV